jgi:2-oxoglutarate ferredoxin oxidoreductase subunit alpha
MTAEDLEAGVEFGRYLDVDGDGIGYRTYPGEHPTRGAYFTRGTSRDRYARYTEDGGIYVDNMQRLQRKWETARSLVPAPVRRDARRRTKDGVIYFGSTAAPMREALDALEAEGVHLDALRLRAFPFSEAVFDFIAEHDQVFVVEQNRDAQMRQLLIAEGGIDPARLVPVLHYEGAPITARFIVGEIGARAKAPAAAPLREVAV